MTKRVVASERFMDPDPYADKYYFFNYDKRGSTTNIVNPDGSSVKQYTYDEFGNVSATGTFDNEITFTGSVSDSSTGLQYMNARFYNPTTGRFLSQDTYTGDPFDPWTQHLYSYCGNNPTNFVDPTGHAPKYISNSEYNTQMNNLINQKSIAERLVNSWASRVVSYSMLLEKHSGSKNFVSQMIASYSENMFNHAQKELRRNNDKLKSINADIADLKNRNELSRKLDNQKKNNKYTSPVEAAGEFLKTAVPETDNDPNHFERSAYITQTTILVQDSNGEIVEGNGYQLSKTYVGCIGLNNCPFIGYQSLAKAIQLSPYNLNMPGEREYYMVHTHPSGSNSLSKAATNNGWGDDQIMTILKATDVFMGSSGGTNEIYHFDSNMNSISTGDKW